MVRNRIVKNAGVDFYVRDFATAIANGTNAPFIGNSSSYKVGKLRIPASRDGSFQFAFDQGVGSAAFSIIAGFNLGRDIPNGTHIAQHSNTVVYGFMFNGTANEGLRVVHEDTLVALPGLFSVGGEIYRVERIGSTMRYFADENLVYSANVTSAAFPLQPVGVLGFTGNAIVDAILIGGAPYTPRVVDPTKSIYWFTSGLSSSGGGTPGRGFVNVNPSNSEFFYYYADDSQLRNSANSTKSIANTHRTVTELRVTDGLQRLTRLELYASPSVKQEIPINDPTTLAQLTNLTALILVGAYMGVAPFPAAPLTLYHLRNSFADRTNRLDFTTYAATLTNLNLENSRLRLFPEIGTCTLLTNIDCRSNASYDAGSYQGNQFANKTALSSVNLTASAIPQAVINTILVELATAVRTRANPATPASNYQLGGTGNGAPSGNTTTLTADAAAGATTITVASSTGFAVGDRIFLEQRNNNEAASLKTITAVTATTITFTGSSGLTTAYFVLDTPPVTIPPTAAVPTTVYNLANGIGARQYIRRRGHTCATN